MFMGAMPKIVKGVISLLGEDIHDGDVILHNDVFTGGNQNADVGVYMPVVHGGESLGIVEAMSHEERPWTRTEINRARIIANQLASVIESFFRVPDSERLV